ncbi:MAG TPA: DUF4342 domain-containing protein [Candidatus Limnocylindria bacterium]|nr:DUF4342 domain-containing protein [Candidatus Limnocylindria bacterium]
MPTTKESLFEQLHIDDLGLDQVLDRVKRLIHEGNVRRLLVKDAQGTTLIEIPLTVGVVGAVLVPAWAAIAAIAAIVADARVVVEKRMTEAADDVPGETGSHVTAGRS